MSTASLRAMALIDHEKIKKLVDRQTAAKTIYLRKATKVTLTGEEEDTNAVCAILCSRLVSGSRWVKMRTDSAIANDVHTSNLDTASFVSHICCPAPTDIVTW